jgi:nucleolar complex protein 2
MFESSEFKGKVKQSTLKPIDFNTSIKTPSTYFGTKIYQKQILEESIKILIYFYMIHCNSISFPELTVGVISSLRRIVKNVNEFATSKEIGALIKVLVENSEFVNKKRNVIEYGPLDDRAVLILLILRSMSL